MATGAVKETTILDIVGEIASLSRDLRSRLDNRFDRLSSPEAKEGQLTETDPANVLDEITYILQDTRIQLASTIEFLQSSVLNKIN